MKKLITLMLILICVSTLGLFANGAQESANEKVTQIEMWHWAANKEPLYQQAIEEYKLVKPELTITTKVIPQDSYRQTLISAQIAGTAPAIIHQQPFGPVWEQYKDGLIIDLTPYVDKEWKDAFYGSTWNMLTINDKILSASFATNNIQGFYNKDRFESLGLEIPTTMDELQNVVKVLRENGYGGAMFWFSNLEQTSGLFLGNARQIYPELVKKADQGDGKWDIPEFNNLISKLASYDDIWETGAASLSMDDAISLFAKGDISIYFIGNWAINNMLANKPQFEIGNFLIPAIDERSKPFCLGSLAGTWTVSNGVSKAEQDVAVEFLRWMALNFQEKLVETIGLAPAGPVGEKALPKVNQLAQNLAKTQSGAILRDWFNRPVRDAISSSIQGVLSGAIQPSEVMKNAQKAADDNR